jgi:hypothetical protein
LRENSRQLQAATSGNMPNICQSNNNNIKKNLPNLPKEKNEAGN